MQPATSIPATQNPTAPPTLLLATKLVPPRLPGALVTRQRLLRDLDVAARQRLTLLSAAAGWGKTTLLAGWIAHQPRSVAWLALDELDDNGTDFWRAVLTALRTVTPALGTPALAMLHSPQPPALTTILTVLLNELNALAEPDPSFLILDDYHLITDPAIHESLAFLLEHLPAQWHVILATRSDPDLPLARWRVRGELGEIRAADLRFTTAEASTFFSQTLAAELAEEDVQRLEQRTEGWVAGLQLAALALRQHSDRPAFVQRFTGSHRYLLDYMQEEILQQQPLAVQRFLLHTAVLTRLNAALCIALTDHPASQQMLEELERNNLFVVPLDEERRWYRLHSLFREVLLARLHTTEPAVVASLHRRAAQWYAAENELPQAITHALTAADFAYAADLIERAAPALWAHSAAQTVHDWVERLPDPIVHQHARFALEAAHYLLESLHSVVQTLYVRGQAQAERTIARVEAGLPPQSAASAMMAGEDLPAARSTAELDLLRRRIRLLRALISARPLLAAGDAEGLRRLAEAIAPVAAQEEMRWQLIEIAITYWYTASIQYQGGLLIPKLLAAKAQALAEGNQVATLRMMRLLVFAYWYDCQFHKLHAECLAALALTEQNGTQTIAVAYLQYTLGCLYYAWNRLDEAVAAMQRVVEIAQLWQQADLLILGSGFLVFPLLARGDYQQAQQALQRAMALLAQERFANHASWIMAAQAEYWLATGNLTAAHTWAQGLDLAPESWDARRNLELLMVVRVYLAQQHYRPALTLLERFHTHLERPGDGYSTLHFLALQVVALQGDGQWQAARSVALRLLALTAPEDYIRLFLEMGSGMQEVLQRLLDAPDSELTPVVATFVTRVLTAFAQEAVAPTRKLPSLSPDPDEGHPLRSPSPKLIEPLTRREEEVLRLLVTGASNQEIADQLVVSLATAKKHVSNVIGKLGVTTRSQAIARARDWALLA